MWNWKYTTTAALIALISAGACTPDEYPTEPRFEVLPDAEDPGHLFVYNVLEGVEVSSVNVAGSFQDPVWNMTATPMPNTWMVTVDLEPGTHEYKYIFNGDQWAGNMCNDTNWGDPDNGFMVDANGEGCVEGGENAVVAID